jgi:2-succinyl-5-enolpyruvyl-6-hydroxy-3-cyclohexene-1-carboxylate synthase
VPAPAVPCSAEANLRASLTLLQALRALGLRRLVLCPGSRSGPLAVAVGLLAAHGVQLLTAVDERSAGFLALGLGRADGAPAALITTSGTAVANLLPAVVEADMGAVPLLLLTADRPARLKGCGANQTVNQEDFLKASCRLVGSADPQGLAAMPASAIEALAGQAWNACMGAPLGPVHLNLPLEEPLHADATALQRLKWLAAEPVLPGLAAGATACPATRQQGPDPWTVLDPDGAGVVVAGPWRGTAAQLPPFAAALLRWQQRTGWPVLADALSGLRGWPGLELVHGYDLLLADPPTGLAAPQLLRLGPMPASRRLQQWVAQSAGPQLLIAEQDPRNLDASGTATLRWAAGLEAWLEAWPHGSWPAEASPAARGLAGRWLAADQRTQAALDRALPVAGPANEPALARALSRLLPPELPLMLASSSPVRDWESFSGADAAHRPVFGFRGASGIDGTLSIACGLALALGRLVLLSGDLALLHDSNGWLWAQQLRTQGVQLTVIVVENGGGGIFEQLPIRQVPGAPLDFERLFAMPQAVSHPALAAVHGVPSCSLEDGDGLAAALGWALEQPVALLEVRTNRQQDAVLRQQLRRRMA